MTYKELRKIMKTNKDVTRVICIPSAMKSIEETERTPIHIFKKSGEYVVGIDYTDERRVGYRHEKVFPNEDLAADYAWSLLEDFLSSSMYHKYH